MSVIVIDGPEKAGKTTLARELELQFERMGRSAAVTHWGPVHPDDREHTELLKQHTADLGTVHIWDRGWPSEYVYGRLLQRTDHRMTEDPWIGEWLHGRAVQAHGLRVILTGPSSTELSRLRDSSDHDVSPAVEQALYREYGRRFGWLVVKNEHTSAGLSKAVGEVMMTYLSVKQSTLHPSKWCGPMSASVLVVGEILSKRFIPGGWLPFTSRFTAMLGRELGDDAFKVAWTNAVGCDPRLMWGRGTVIACGMIAFRWCRKYKREKEDQRLVYIPHPSHMYRYNNERTEVMRSKTREVLHALLPL